MNGAPRHPSSGREAWVDYARALGIVLVVYGHVARGVFNAGIPMDVPLFRMVDSVVYSFHMPLFFFLSGIFFLHSLKRRRASSLVCNKIDTLIYPYILWSLIQGLTEVWLTGYTNGNLSLIEVFSLWNPRAQFWFLYALFLVFIAAILLYRRESRPLLLIVLAVSVLGYVYQREIPSALHSDYVVKNFVFFALGVWFNTVKDRLAMHPGRWALAGVLAFASVQYGFHGWLRLTHEDKGVASLVVAVVSILAVATLSMWLARRPARWVLALGSASMGIYLMHILAGSGARILVGRVLGVHDATLHIAAGCLAGILLPLLVVHVAGRLGIRGLFEAPPRLSAEGWWRRRFPPKGIQVG